MHIAVKGQGPNLVMLHGWSMHSAVWHDLAESLAQHYTLYLVDLPGHGDSQWQQGDFELPFLMEQLKLQLPEQAYYLGWSLGGLIAALFSYHYPQHVKKLVMMAASPCFTDKQDWPCAMKQAVFKDFAVSLDEEQAETLHRFLLLQARGSQHSKQTIRQLSDKIAGKSPPKQALKAGLDILINSDIRPQLAQLARPIKLILAEKDTLIPVAMQDYIKQINPKAETAVIAGAGHAPFISHPEQCLAEIQSFLTAGVNDD